MGNHVVKKPNFGYNESIKKVIDPYSGQAIMGRFELYPLWSTKVKGEQPYNHEIAQAMLTRHLQKLRRSQRAIQPLQRKCAAFFLVDRIHFRGHHINHWLYYRQILEFRRADTISSAFILFTVDRDTFVRSYESYECVYADEAKQFEMFLNQCLIDPQGLIETQPNSEVPLADACLIRPHYTYRDASGYNELRQLFELDEDVNSWKSIDEDENIHEYDMPDLHPPSYLTGSDRNERDSYRYLEQRKRLERNNQTPISVYSANPDSPAYSLTHDQISQLPVARRIIIE